jgi:hypothetical protein
VEVLGPKRFGDTLTNTPASSQSCSGRSTDLVTHVRMGYHSGHLLAAHQPANLPDSEQETTLLFLGFKLFLVLSRGYASRSVMPAMLFESWLAGLDLCRFPVPQERLDSIAMPPQKGYSRCHFSPSSVT